MKPILVDGGWSDYSSTSSSCSTTCEREVTRECNNPSPCGGGNDCNGPSANYECCDNCTGMFLLKKNYKLSIFSHRKKSLHYMQSVWTKHTS